MKPTNATHKSKFKKQLDRERRLLEQQRKREKQEPKQ